MTTYKHTQIGWAIWLPIVIASVVVFSFGIFYGERFFMEMAGAFMNVVLFFSNLTVSVNEKRIRASFCFGLFGKRFLFKKIVSASAVRNRWWYRFGIRITPHGWLFNVYGLDAVEVIMKSGRKFRIGTDESQKLLEQIQAKLRR